MPFFCFAIYTLAVSYRVVVRRFCAFYRFCAFSMFPAGSSDRAVHNWCEQLIASVAIAAMVKTPASEYIDFFRPNRGFIRPNNGSIFVRIWIFFSE